MAAQASAPPSIRTPQSLKPKKSFFQRVVNEPNAIWMREMRQASRLGRTPWVLFGVALTISLLMCSIGGIAAVDTTTPASLGGALFQTFFSLAYLVVVIVGPTVAANSIASEREGKTWEAVLLTGLHPKDIARGKFMAAYTTIALYIVVLAPVGALPFLFGGVGALEVVVAFVFLFLVAALAVAFGLAVSSLMSSLRGAIVVTLMLAICIGPGLYAMGGFGLSFAVHKQWNDIPEGLPIWLPLALSRAPLSADYLLLLVALPTVLILMPAWFLYEVTIANLTGETDDRSSGLKRWFFFSAPIFAVPCALPSILADSDNDRMGWAVVGLTLFGFFAGFCSLLFAFDPQGPSRRVLVHWHREKAGALRRFFGPGLTKTVLLVVLFGMLCFGGIAAVDAIALYLAPTPPAPGYPTATRWDLIAAIIVFGLYGLCFFVFSAGLTSYLRARGSTPWVARLISSAIIFLIAAGPWVVAAIGGVMSGGHEDDWLIVGSPSPFYAYAMISWLSRATKDSMPVVPAGLVCAFGWGFIGLILVAATGRRCSKVVREQNAQLSQAEAALKAEEDAKREAASA